MEKYISNVASPIISIAPMVDVTNSHFRHFTRLLLKDALLYTEMLSALSIIHNEKVLYFKKTEGKVALQIAASTPDEAYKAIKIAEAYDYSEVNLNCGCPSDRVSGNFMGAALMSSKELVYEILCAMREATNKPVTIKHRIGIDGTGVLDETNSKVIMEGYDDLLEFLEVVSKAKPDRYIIHARTAILKGLSPKENREIPPLDYDMVYKIKKDFPYLNIEINGGFRTLDSIQEALTKVDSVMLGRVAYEDSYFLTKLNQLFMQGNTPILSRGEIIQAYIPYILEELELGTSIYTLVEPLQSLFHGQRGSKLYRQLLSSPSIKRDNAIQVFNRILDEMPQDILWEK